jgi:hypothetical protein
MPVSLLDPLRSRQPSGSETARILFQSRSWHSAATLCAVGAASVPHVRNDDIMKVESVFRELRHL